MWQAHFWIRRSTRTFAVTPSSPHLALSLASTCVALYVPLFMSCCFIVVLVSVNSSRANMRPRCTTNICAARDSSVLQTRNGCCIDVVIDESLALTCALCHGLNQSKVSSDDARVTRRSTAESHPPGPIPLSRLARAAGRFPGALSNFPWQATTTCVWTECACGTFLDTANTGAQQCQWRRVGFLCGRVFTVRHLRTAA